MMMPSFSFANFKKTKEDDHSATLRHPEGHEIRIAKKLLSPKMKADLSKLPLHKAEGGGVQMPEQGDSGDYKSEGLREEADRSKQAPIQINIGTNGAAGMPPPNGPEFFQPPPGPTPTALANYQQPMMPAQAPMPAPAPAPSQNPIDEAAASPRGDFNDAMYQQALNEKANAANQAPSQPAEAAASTPQDLATQNQQKIDGILKNQPQGTAPASMDLTKSPYFSGLQEQTAAIRKQAGVEENLGNEQSKLYGANADAIQAQQQKFQTDTAKLQYEMNSFKNDLANQHIDPTRYLSSLPSWGKISTALGLLLGGIGGGANNAAQNFVNDQINRDIAAQKDNVGIKKSLLDANIQQWGNMNQAMTATRMMYNEMLANHIEQQKSTFAGPMAQAKADELIGKIHTQTGQMQMMFGMMGQGGSNPNPDQTASQINMMRMMNPELAKNMESRFVPNVGLGQVPIPEKDRTEIIARTNLDAAVNDLRKFSEEHAGTTLNREIVNQGQAKAALVQDAYRRANAQGVFREAEKNFVETIVDQDPTKFFSSWRTIPKYNQLADDNLRQLDGLKKGYGLPVPYRPPSRKKF